MRGFTAPENPGPARIGGVQLGEGDTLLIVSMSRPHDLTCSSYQAHETYIADIVTALQGIKLPRLREGTDR